jgi:hypothetical protein
MISFYSPRGLTACGNPANRSALAITLGLSVSSAGSASALGAETFGCRIAPGTEFNFYEFCHNTQPASQYGVAFLVQNGSGSPTYSWSIPAFDQSKISQGCTWSSPSCTLMVGKTDQDIPVSVTLTQGGVFRTISSEAMIFSYCDPCNYC